MLINQFQILNKEDNLMEIDIKGNLKIRCNCCNKIYNIESESFMEDITYEEGNMDTRVLHEYRDRFNCDKCGTHLSYDYMVSEYVGAIEFVSTDAHNCTVIEEPTACISIYEFFSDRWRRINKDDKRNVRIHNKNEWNKRKIEKYYSRNDL